MKSINYPCCVSGERTISEYEFPFMGSIRVLSSTTKHSWTIKTSTQLEKPRYVIFTLQTNRKNNMITHKIYFDNCKLTNVKLYLNSEFFPYDDLNLDFDKRRTAILYYNIYLYISVHLTIKLQKKRYSR